MVMKTIINDDDDIDDDDIDDDDIDDDNDDDDDVVSGDNGDI